MENLIKITKLLPNYDEIQNFCADETEAKYIINLATKHTSEQAQNAKAASTDAAEEVAYLLQSLVDRCWERIHTGHFSEVPLHIRKIYAVANFFRIIYYLFESLQVSQVEKCSEVLDDAMLIGCTQNLYAHADELRLQLMHLIDSLLAKSIQIQLPIITAMPRKPYACDIAQIECPSVSHFQQHYFESLQPVLLLNTINHWPALKKWPDLNYILRIAGNRRVPIEIGSNYATEDWSQQLVKVRDFLHRQFSSQNKLEHQPQDIEYLAQHELFDQIPALKSDICVPDYCSLGSQSETVDIKAWLGPAGTISPLHFDPKHNLLCQVFGIKKILLVEANSTSNLYPHETEFLGNTSQIDAEHLDLEKFPLLAHVKFHELTLQAGDCLYIPPKWWHYVRAINESFSVSFWWN